MIIEGSQTRAELARQRMAELMASFDAQATTTQRVGPRSHAAEAAWRVPPTHLRALVTVAVAAGVLLTWWLLSARPRTSEPTPVHVSSAANHDPIERTLIIDVEGKVKHPGIVTLPRGSRVHQAIAKAGGLANGADTSTTNLARVVVDGEQIIVGTSVAASGAPSVPGDGPPVAGGRVSLNSATAEQLDGLPDVGPVTAQAIIAYRTAHGGFRRVEDLLNVKGIGEKTLAELRDQVSP